MAALMHNCIHTDTQLLHATTSTPTNTSHAQSTPPTRLQLLGGGMAQLAQAYRINQLLPVFGCEAVVLAAMLSVARRCVLYGCVCMVLGAYLVRCMGCVWWGVHGCSGVTHRQHGQANTHMVKCMVNGVNGGVDHHSGMTCVCMLFVIVHTVPPHTSPTQTTAAIPPPPPPPPGGQSPPPPPWQRNGWRKVP